MGVSTSEQYWQDVIDAYYKKYHGIKTWHDSIVYEAKTKGKLEIPSGRYYPFAPEPSYNGYKWPITKIKNYPVQGFGADLVKLARLEAKKNLQASGLEAKLVSTVHDSIVADIPDKNLDLVARILMDAVESVPRLCKQVWDYDFNLPLTAELQYGPNKKEMEEYVFA
jgi:DNA polymerase-1